jgi:hypothetical protein
MISLQMPHREKQSLTINLPPSLAFVLACAILAAILAGKSALQLGAARQFACPLPAMQREMWLPLWTGRYSLQFSGKAKKAHL